MSQAISLHVYSLLLFFTQPRAPCACVCGLIVIFTRHASGERSRPPCCACYPTRHSCAQHHASNDASRGHQMQQLGNKMNLQHLVAAMQCRANRVLTYLIPNHISCTALGQPLHSAQPQTWSPTILHKSNHPCALHRHQLHACLSLSVPGCMRACMPNVLSSMDHDQQLMYASISHVPCSRVPLLGSQIQRTWQKQYSIKVLLIIGACGLLCCMHCSAPYCTGPFSYLSMLWAAGCYWLLAVTKKHEPAACSSSHTST